MGALVRKWLWDNPAVARERTLRAGRERGGGPAEALRWAGALAVLALYLAAAWWLTRPERDVWQGRGFLFAASMLHLLLCTLVLPGLGAGALSVERERETWQELLLTRLEPSQLVAAKLLSVMEPAGRLLLGALPLFLMGAHAGRLPPGRLLLLLLLLGAAGVTLAVVSLWLATRFRRSLTAGVTAYLAAGIAVWGTLAPLEPLMVRGENPWWYVSPVWHAAVLTAAEPQLSPLVRPLLPEWCWFVLLCGVVVGLCTRSLVRWVARWESSG